MSFQYDQYLARHRANVKRGFDWLSENLPGLMTNTLTAGWNTEFAHDQSKNEPNEYEAYDAYFYGNNRSYEVVQRYQRAWLLHIHRNPHHWQHWVLIHDDMEDGELETVLEMPYDYIIEMICDWWSFSWQSGNLYEIFKWYEEHSKYIKLAQTTKITVEYILDNMKKKLQALQYADQSAMQPGDVWCMTSLSTCVRKKAETSLSSSKSGIAQWITFTSMRKPVSLCSLSRFLVEM